MLERFLARVEYEPNTGCWLWSGGQTSDGYGVAQHRKRTLLAHRVSWELHEGEEPRGRLVCHRCDTPACVNPAHLFLGSQSENMADMKRKGRADRAKKQGQRNGRAKLTDDQASEVRTLLRLGCFDQRAIARSYGVSDSTLSRIARGESFAHIHPDWAINPRPLEQHA